jgi:hypothetical protein
MNKSLLVALFLAAPITANAKFDCIPGLFEWSSVYNFEGTEYSWLCRRADGKYYINGFAVLTNYEIPTACKDELAQLKLLRLTGTALNAELLTTANKVFDSCKTSSPIVGSRDDVVMKVLHSATIVLWNPPVPAVVYVVKPNASLTYRFTYPIIPDTGKRSLTYNGRADVNVTCDPSKAKVVEGTNIYMAFAPLFNPKTVTLCALKP